MPSIVDGLFAGRAGIQSNGTAISVLADNIANQNTTGFKAARADFVDLLAGSLGAGSGASSTGSGSGIGKITRILNQGTFEATGRGLDIGIDGTGFLVVEDNFGTRFFTRAGNLQIDPEGYLLDQNGHQVQGFPASGSGSLESLNVNQRVSQDIATGTLKWGGNLDASGAVNTFPTALPTTPGLTFSQLSTNAGFQYTQTVFDSLGASHDVSGYFYKTGSNAWTSYFYTDSADIGTGTPAGNPSFLGSVNLSFNSSGQLITSTTPGTTTITPAWSSGASAGSIDVDISKFTQFASKSTLSNAEQNGTGSGSVTGFSVQSDGTLVAKLDNGQSASIGVIALATFANAEGLQRQGNSLFTQSVDSGDAVIGQPGIGVFGKIQSGALELSTADLAADFIKLISLQRGFQGSSRIVSSVNDLLTEIVNLNR